jgi:hypothetical protein
LCMPLVGRTLQPRCSWSVIYRPSFAVATPRLNCAMLSPCSVARVHHRMAST